MSDNYSERKTQVIREFLAAEFQPPYIIETVLPLRDPLADTKFKIMLNNQVERSFSVCPAVVLDSLPTPDQLKQLLVSKRIMDKIKSSVALRICQDDLEVDEPSHVRPMRSVRGI